MSHAEVLSEGRDRLLAALRPLLQGVSRVALLDFPAHSNVGDSAIWLGALAALRDVGSPQPVYTCDAETYDKQRLKQALREGVILFTGGGSFGDLWGRHLLFREQVVKDFPANRIIQLPESVHFETDVALARAKATFNSHDDITIMTRDARSFTFIEKHFTAAALLVPDTAFALGSLRRSRKADAQVLWLKRADKEDRWPAAELPTQHVTDWLAEPHSHLIAVTDRVRRVGRRHAWARTAADGILHSMRSRIATHRMERGISTLSRGRVVVTDRLHGHIVSSLLNIPHVVLDNSYGKLHNYVAQWTQRSPIVRIAHSVEEAHAAAQELLVAHDV